MAGKISRGEGLHISSSPENQKDMGEVLSKARATAETKRVEQASSLLDKLIQTIGLEGIKKLISQKESKKNSEAHHLLSSNEQANITSGESGAKTTAQYWTEYKLDENNPDRILAEIITGADGSVKKVDYTYDDQGMLKRRITSNKQENGTETRMDEGFQYDTNGKLETEHSTRSLHKPGEQMIGYYKDILYLRESDPRLANPAQLKPLGTEFSQILVTDNENHLVEKYGFGGFDTKTPSGEYRNNAIDQKTTYTYDLKGRVLTEDHKSDGKLTTRYSFSYQDNPDGSYTKTRKDIGPNKEKYGVQADTTQEYDSRGNLIAEKYDDGKNLKMYTRDKEGRPLKISRRILSGADSGRTNPGWQYAEYTYDTIGRQSALVQKEQLEQNT